MCVNQKNPSSRFRLINKKSKIVFRVCKVAYEAETTSVTPTLSVKKF